MSGPWRRRAVFAVGLSLGVHVALFASRCPTRVSTSEQLARHSVELVPLLAEPPPEPPPESPPEPEPAPPADQPSPPRLAAKMTPTQFSRPRPRPSLPVVEPVEPPPEPEPRPAEPETVVVPAIPSAREAALKRSAEGVPRPPTDREKVEGRVVAMMKEALRPLPNDGSPMPELRPDGRGNLIHENGAFYAKIGPDGSVSFGRKRGVTIEGFGSDSPDPAEREILEEHTRIPGVPLTVFKSTPNDEARGEAWDRAGLGIGFRPKSDLNDAILYAKGDDPLAARKRRFLRLTQELRDELLAKSQQREVSFSKIRASRHLERLWKRDSVSFANKRLRLFDLWDECEEPVDDADESPTARAGLRARAQILRFIRQKLPRGSPEAYAPDELRRLNARRKSREVFRPYP